MKWTLIFLMMELGEMSLVRKFSTIAELEACETTSIIYEKYKLNSSIWCKALFHSSREKSLYWFKWNMERWFFFSCRGVSSNDFSSLEALCKKIIKEKQTFERLEVKKETLLEMFKVNWALTTSILSANPWSSAPKFPLEKTEVLVCSEKCDLTHIPAT